MENLVKRPEFKSHYDNYIGGKFTPPVNGKYFDNISPIDGKVYTKAAVSYTHLDVYKRQQLTTIINGK